MQIDYALILSAGFGTRMGAIGKFVPKVMWPILNKKLIDLQISFCKNLGVEKIYINTHYLSEVIAEHIDKNYPQSIVILHEDPILDSGGAIHNLAKRPEVQYKGNLLLVNGDQLYLFDQLYFKKALDHLRDCRGVLFGISVKADELYNETKLVNDQLVSIEKPSRHEDFITYSGLGILKLDGLKPTPGVSKFFESVVNFKTEKVLMLNPEKVEYWDFGTAKIYFENMFKIFFSNLDNNLVKDFFEKNGVMVKNANDYISKSMLSIRFNKDDRFEQESIVSNEIVQKV